ncbi:ATP-binding protein [Consotaella salsifontis]|uniref:histidine kinase n=1 Tax=Consotaella salsifontis TaxID=1365950 RepID=A0A1T4NJ14_9HYPH|nr:ATP-binding protein [Consotaella salsifontis]SJZ79290.1 PAS domain S-box-containing protein [Consotaella salsifontis]
MILSLRLTAAMVALVTATAAAVGLLIYERTTTAVLPTTLNGLKANAGLIANHLEGFVEGARSDILALAEMPPIPAATNGECAESSDAMPHSLQQRRQEAAAVLGAIAAANPHDLTLRLISPAPEPAEVLRASRATAGGPVRITEPTAPGTPLMEPDIVAAAQNMGKGEVFISRITFDGGNPEIGPPPMPMLRLATPLFNAAGKACGLITLKVDLRPALRQFTSRAFTDSSVYLVDEDGSYLADASSVYGFARRYGPTARFEDDWPRLAALTQATEPQAIQAETRDGVPVAATVWPVVLGDTRRVSIVETLPLPSLLDRISNVKTSSMIVGAIAAIVAAVVAGAIGLSITRPLRTMARAVSEPLGQPLTPLPVDAAGEAGVLARALDRYMSRDAMLGAVVASSFDAIATQSLDGTVTSWNAAAEAIYGFSAAEVIGTTLETIAPEDYRSVMRHALFKVARGTQVDELQGVWLHKNGGRRNVSLRMWPARNRSGKVFAACVVATDVTDRLADTQRLRRLQAEAAHASRVNAAGHMASMLSHELRQPLTAAINYATSVQRLINQRSDGDEKLKTYLGKMIEQTRRAADLIQRMRDFIGNPGTLPEVKNVNEVVEGGVETALMGHERIRVVRQYHRDLPPVTVDRVQVQQVVSNLVRNAAEAMAEVKPATLVIATRPAGANLIEVSVGDTGPGFAPGLHYQLFKPFQTTKPHGMGLGLSICRSIVEAHGGTIAVASDDHGTTVNFTLPIARGQS